MYNSTILADRIKIRAKEQHIQLKSIWSEIGITDNTLTNLRKGSMLGADKLALIADYLDCSVDYLLGRTDNPNITADTYINGDNNGIQAVSRDNSNMTVTNAADTSNTSDDKKLLDMIKELNIVDRSKIILQIDELKNKK